MNINDIGQPIADRKLTVGDKSVVVTIGKPTTCVEGEDYYCPYSIEYAGKKKVSYAIGMDSVQALQLTFKMIGVDLALIAEESGMQVCWLPDTPGETGFPS